MARNVGPQLPDQAVRPGLVELAAMNDDQELRRPHRRVPRQGWNEMRASEGRVVKFGQYLIPTPLNVGNFKTFS